MSDNYLDAIAAMPRSVYDRLLAALETGLWPDQSNVTAEQREHAMQAVIAWGQLHLPEGERVGFIDKGYKGGDHCDEPQTLQWVEE
jgi:uncharacterized protein YeaC (DUF1315 family)